MQNSIYNNQYPIYNSNKLVLKSFKKIFKSFFNRKLNNYLVLLYNTNIWVFF